LAIAASIRPGTGTTQLVASILWLATASFEFKREQVIRVLALARHLLGIDEALGVDLGREVPRDGCRYRWSDDRLPPA
jgi:hypothetical protein